MGTASQSNGQQGKPSDNGYAGNLRFLYHMHDNPARSKHSIGSFIPPPNNKN
jgi:hypothetical protein